MTLARFHAAQAATYPAALAELRAGRKASHWMWFVFPQLASLGRSATARHYGLAGLQEARDYLADPVLRDRLVAAAGAMLAHPGTPPEAILGETDAMKLRSSMTLFAAADPAVPEFAQVIGTFYAGLRCPLTLAALQMKDNE